jgi:serine/threonine protein kinase
MVIEYLEGRDLMSLWKDKKMTDSVIIMGVLKGILEGIRDIHSYGILHRDLKPQNIHIDPVTNKPFIIDFGLSLILDERVTAKSYKRCGTMGYMAP